PNSERRGTPRSTARANEPAGAPCRRRSVSVCSSWTPGASMGLLGETAQVCVGVLVHDGVHVQRARHITIDLQPAQGLPRAPRAKQAVARNVGKVGHPWFIELK